METGIFIVPDSVVEGQTPKSEYLAANYNTEDKAEIDVRNETLEEIQEWFDAQNLSNPRLFIGINTKANIMAASVGLGAIASFLGIYIGFIFLISGAAILALKELSESTDNVERYRMLRKLGVDRKMMNHALFSQMGLFFPVPACTGNRAFGIWTDVLQKNAEADGNRRYGGIHFNDCDYNGCYLWRIFPDYLSVRKKDNQ